MTIFFDWLLGRVSDGTKALGLYSGRCRSSWHRPRHVCVAESVVVHIRKEG